ncbi:hypothetical protein M0802_001645 [Mischocyttarus mexicanus]|nr:hypothetical protein M0802_001645 [Mischocyttarus mexicanus]
MVLEEKEKEEEEEEKRAKVSHVKPMWTDVNWHRHIEYDKHYMESKTPGPRSNHEEVTASEDPREMLKSLRLQHSNKISDEELFLKIIVNGICPRVAIEKNSK